MKDVIEHLRKAAETNGLLISRKEKFSAIGEAIRKIERQVEQIDSWAKENADKGYYSTAGLQQAEAVNLHCAVALIKPAHTHHISGFNVGIRMGEPLDVCEGCLYEAWERINKT